MSAREDLFALNTGIRQASEILRPHETILQAFLSEATLMDCAGPIIDPTLYACPERQAAEAIVKPVYRACLNFLQALDAAAHASSEHTKARLS